MSDTETATAPAVLTERRDNVLLITLNRPDARNAVNAALAQGVADALDELDGTRELQVGVLTGAGKGFSANALAPSCASCETNTGPEISPCRAQNSSSLQSRERSRICLVASRASGPLSAMRAASSSAASTAPPGSASRLITPSSWARSASIGSPVSASSIARP